MKCSRFQKWSSWRLSLIASLCEYTKGCQNTMYIIKQYLAQIHTSWIRRQTPHSLVIWNKGLIKAVNGLFNGFVLDFVHYGKVCIPHVLTQGLFLQVIYIVITKLCKTLKNTNYSSRSGPQVWPGGGWVCLLLIFKALETAQYVFTALIPYGYIRVRWVL